MQAWALPQEVSQDPILGLSRVCMQDPRENKLDLLAGVLKKEGKIWLFESVKEAQKELSLTQAHKGYLPIEGNLKLLELLSQQMGIDPSAWSGLQTLGATGALSLASSLLEAMGGKKILVSQPSWPNHRRIFEVSGLEVIPFSYPFEHLESLYAKAQGIHTATILLQACCHNPTGMDLDDDTLQELFDWAAKEGHCLLIDMAYQGLKKSMWEDAQAIRLALEKDVDLMVAYSCAKNFTLYGERTGSLFIRLKDPLRQKRALEYLSHLARARYSNPPLNGSAIVTHLLQSESLRALWQKELTSARELLQMHREKLAVGFIEAGFQEMGESIRKQAGMFAYFSMEPEAIEWLKTHQAIYLPKEGRISLTSLSMEQIPRVMQALSLAFSRSD